jgi:hypothetical protein
VNEVRRSAAKRSVPGLLKQSCSVVVPALLAQAVQDDSPQLMLRKTASDCAFSPAAKRANCGLPHPSRQAADGRFASGARQEKTVALVHAVRHDTGRDRPEIRTPA